MQIRGVRAQFDLVLGGNVAEIHILAGGSHLADAEDLRFLVGLGGEASGEDIVSRMLFRRKVQGNHGELLACAALDEENIVVISKPHEFLDIGLGLVVYLVVLLCAVADLEDGHAAVPEVQKLGLCFLQNFQGKCGGPGIEIIDAICFQSKPS